MKFFLKIETALEKKIGLKNTKSAKQFIKFGIVGLSNTIISQGITYILIFLGKNYQINLEENLLVFLSSLIGFSISVFNSYYWNNKFVFNKTIKGHFKPFIKSYISYGLTWLLSFALTFLFANTVKISSLWIPLISMIITIPLNFFMNKFWAFK